jgi:hypothetical protein
VIIGALAQNLNSQSSNYRVPSKLSISTIGWTSFSYSSTTVKPRSFFLAPVI